MTLLTIPTPPIVLRPYQAKGIADLKATMRTVSKRVLLVMPTGAGKTATAAEMMRSASEKRSTVLWLVDRIELVEQASEAFHRAGVPHTFMLPGHEPDKLGKAYIGTIQTFLARERQQKWLPSQVNFVVIDEAHRTESASYKKALALYPDAYVVGLTATPVRGDGKGLGNSYGALVQPVSMADLLRDGYLVPPRYFIPSEMDMAALQGKKSEYSQKDMEALAAANPQLIGDAVETFARVCPDRRAVAFPMTIRHSIGLRDAFNAVGIPACHIDGDTPAEERRDLMADFRAGIYQVLTSVNIAIEGLDVPDVSAVIMLRPTKSERIWIQAVGRGLRSFPGKKDCIVLDHSGVLVTLGPAEDFTAWTLEHGSGDAMKKGGKGGDKRDPKDITCENCDAVFFSRRDCPECGHEHVVERSPRHIEITAGTLEELTAEGRKQIKVTAEEKAQWYAMLLWVANGQANRASGMFKGKFGHWPAKKHGVQAIPPSQEVLAAVQAQRIAYAKGQEKAKGGWKVTKVEAPVELPEFVPTPLPPVPVRTPEQIYAARRLA